MMLEGYRDISGATVSPEKQIIILCYSHVTLFHCTIQIFLTLVGIWINLLVIKQKMFCLTEILLKNCPEIKEKEDSPVLKSDNEPPKIDSQLGKTKINPSYSYKLCLMFVIMSLFCNVVYLVLCFTMSAVLVLCGPGLKLDFSQPQFIPGVGYVDSVLSLGKFFLNFCQNF